MGSVKRLLLLLSLSLLATVLFVPLAWGETTIVTFSDQNLEAAVREQLGIPTEDITSGQMQGLKSLDASEREIWYLDGLEHATNLNYLNLSGNFISDISALQGLTNLWELDLRYNNIADISPLFKNSGLSSDTLIRLGGNQLNLATGSPERQAISQLVYQGIQVSYVFPDLALEEAVLRCLDFDINYLSPENISEKLTVLDASNPEIKIKDLSGLEYALSLEELNLNFNLIHDIWPLHNCTNLALLELANNQIEDISALSSCTNLTSLNLSNNKIEDITVLYHYPALSYLNLSNNEISEIFSLLNLVNLSSVDLSGNWLDLNTEFMVPDRFVIEIMQKIPDIAIIVENQKWSVENISKLITFQAGDSPDHVTQDLWLSPEYYWSSDNPIISIGEATNVYPIGQLPVYVIPGYIAPIYWGQDNRVKLSCYAGESENPVKLPVTVVIGFTSQVTMQTEHTYLVPKIVTGEGSSPREFTVDIMAENLGEIRGFEFVLLYDPELVEIVAQGDNPLQLSPLFSELSVFTLCNNKPGIFEYECNALGEGSVFVIGRESLGQITFRVKKEGALEFAFDLNPYNGKTSPDYGRTVLFKLVGPYGNEWFYNPQYSRVVFLYHPADLDQSGKVGLEDLVKIARDFHLTENDEGWKEDHNLYYNYGENITQIIDVFDLDVVARNYDRAQWDYYPFGDIEGIVTLNSLPLAGVSIELWNLDHAEKCIIADSDGRFFLYGVPAGVPYTLRVYDPNRQLIGFQENIIVMPEKRLNITLALSSLS